MHLYSLGEILYIKSNYAVLCVININRENLSQQKYFLMQCAGQDVIHIIVQEKMCPNIITL